MQIAPNNTKKQAITLRFPLSTLQLSSLRKSSASSSIRAANTSSPEETAFMVPTRISPNSELGL